MVMILLIKVCVSVDLRAGQHPFKALVPGICLQEEGGRDKERHCEERQYLGSIHLQEGPGTGTASAVKTPLTVCLCIV